MPFTEKGIAMKRLVNWDRNEGLMITKGQANPKRKMSSEGFGMGGLRVDRGGHDRMGQCAECGGEVKVFVSPRRNPHSSKLGRAVSMKDHDLCRRCWRRLMHNRRANGIVALPLSLFIGSKKLRPRLLEPKPPALPQIAS